MILSFYTWASGLYAIIPKFAIVDLILSLLTLLHLFVAFCFASVADAVYKKPLMKLHCSFTKFFYDIPLCVPAFGLGLTLITAQLTWRAYCNPENTAVTLRAVVSIYTWVCSIFLQKLSFTLVKMGVNHTLSVEQEVERHDIRNWKAPPKWTISCIAAPLMWIMRPEVIGGENIPTDHPGLYVMNHGLLGLEMAPFIATVYHLKDVFLRGLSDNIHFGHLHGEFIRYFGGVNGTRDNVDTLMENKYNVLVYPGGGHEVMKPCAVPKYTLMWKQRVGFARMAIKHGYPIVPCASVGTEDMMDKLFDVNLEFARKGLKCPGVVILPHKLQKVYFWFGEPIPTAQYNGDWQNDDYAKEVRDKAKASVEAGIRELQDRQTNDPNRFLFRHMANAMVQFCMDPFAGSDSASFERANKEPLDAPKKLD